MTSAREMQEIKSHDYNEMEKNELIEMQMLDDFSLKLNPGRPDFDALFADIYANKRAKDVDVFFCGNREFGQTVQKAALNQKFKFNKEYF